MTSLAALPEPDATEPDANGPMGPWTEGPIGVSGVLPGGAQTATGGALTVGTTTGAPSEVAVRISASMP